MSRFSFWRAARAALICVFPAIVLFTLYLWWQDRLYIVSDSGASRLAEGALGQLLAMACLGLLVGIVGTAAAARHYGKLLVELNDHLSALVRDSVPHALERRETAAELDPLKEQMEVLAGCYRKALAEVVQAHEVIESMRNRGHRGNHSPAAPSADQRHAPPPTRYLLGSSRHRMVMRLAPNLHWMAATPPMQYFVGAGIRDLVARSFLEWVHPDDAPFLERTFQDILREGEGHNITFRMRIPQAPASMAPASIVSGTAAGPVGAMRPAGLPSGKILEAGAEVELRHLQMDVMACYTDSGEPLHLRCHFVDITDRIRTEQELRRRTEELSQANAQLRQINLELQRLKESYRDLYHYAPVLYFSLDTRGNFVAFNETMLRTLGYPREALLAQPYTRLLPVSSRQAFLEDPAVFQSPGELQTEWVKQDGTVIHVWIATTTIKDPQGQFVRSRSVARDVTERNRLENALRTKADELGDANAQLRRINQELEDFTYVVSHDLKEPLRTLQAFSNFLLLDYSEALGDEGHEYITHLIQASMRLGELIDDLLTLSRAGRVIHTPRAFSWDDTLRTVLSDLQELVQRKGASVQVAGPLPPVAGDPERVGQLLTNLVSNALKYNQNSRPEVTIGALPVEERRDSRSSAFEGVSFFVRDNGIGIEPQYHEQIFRMFRRLHRRDEIEGTGAGLAICKKIVEAHGGTIWVESEPGQGATFFFSLPRLRPGSRTTTVLLPPRTQMAPAPETMVSAGAD